MQHPGPGPGHDNPYRVLGVDPDASRQDIARAYRRAVHDAHPDTRPGDPRAAARFQALTDAYDLLNDPGRRADYDRRHPPGPPDTTQRRPGPPAAASRPYGPPIWAGPAHVEPSAGRAEGRSRPEAADFDDPPVLLGWRSGRRGIWPR